MLQAVVVNTYFGFVVVEWWTLPLPLAGLWVWFLDLVFALHGTS